MYDITYGMGPQKDQVNVDLMEVMECNMDLGEDYEQILTVRSARLSAGRTIVAMVNWTVAHPSCDEERRLWFMDITFCFCCGILIFPNKVTNKRSTAIQLEPEGERESREQR